MWMEPRLGNAYLILVDQYIGAELNVLNGASLPQEAFDAWDEARDLLTAYEAELSIPKGEPDRDRALELKGLLEDYNTGHMGPGYCSE